MEQAPLNQGKQSENKNAINIPPIPAIPPVSPVSSGFPVTPPVKSAPIVSPVGSARPVPPPMQSNRPMVPPSVKSELENARLELENAPVSEVTPKPLMSEMPQGAGQQFKLASTEVQGPKPPLVAVGGSKFAKIAIGLVLVAVLGIGGYYFYSKDNVLSPETSPAVVPPKISPVADKNLDSDKDGLPDAIEKVIGTYITKADTDGDGYTDLQEIKSGYSPLIAGAAGKYTPEERDLIKGKIKTEDKDFYEREFGTPAMSTPTSTPTPAASITSTPTAVPSPL